MIVLKKYNTYIFKGKRAGKKDFVFKGRVSDLTETTIMVENLDNEALEDRYLLEVFHHNYEAIELTLDFSKALLEASKQSRFEIVKASFSEGFSVTKLPPLTYMDYRL